MSLSSTFQPSHHPPGIVLVQQHQSPFRWRHFEPSLTPRKGSAFRVDEYLKVRNDNLRLVREHGAEAWKERASYHRRSLAETAVYRFKTLFSDRLRSREVERRRTGVVVRCVAMNRMATLGMPRSYAT